MNEKWITLSDGRRCLVVDHEHPYCRDCGSDLPNSGEFHYMVHRHIWDAAVPEDADAEPMTVFLCIGCLEQRLGRTLTPADFPTDVLLNTLPRNRSWRLQSRLDGNHHT